MKTTASATESDTIDGVARPDRYRHRLALLLLLSLVSPGQAEAAALADDNLSPLIATIGLPQAYEGAELLQRGRFAWRTSVATASHSTQDEGNGERLVFDGETTRLAFGMDYGITDRLQVGVEIPWLLHEGGGLDGFIERWHDWFGLPNGVRDTVASDQIDFLYEDTGTLRLDQQARTRGLSDIRLLAAWQLRRDSRSATALRLSLKLPTGDSHRLTGSGGTDVSLGIAGDYAGIFGTRRFDGFYRAQLILVGEPERLGDRARPVIGQVSGGASFAINDRLGLTAQARLRSAAYDSDIRTLGEPAMLLNVGGHIRLSERLQLAISVGEDIRVDTAPDVTFGLALQYTASQ